MLFEEVADSAGDLARVWVTVSFAQLVKDALFVDENVELTAAAGIELGFDTEFVFKLRSQTGRAGQVVSNLAVLDADLHGGNFSNRRCFSVTVTAESTCVSINPAEIDFYALISCLSSW